MHPMALNGPMASSLRAWRAGARVVGLALWLGAVVSASGQQFAGRIDDVGGLAVSPHVQVARQPGAWSTATTNAPQCFLDPGNEVMTKRDGSARLSLYPTHRTQTERKLTLGPNTLYRVPMEKQPMGLVRGLFQFFSRASDQDWDLDTGTVLCGAHGTELMVRVEEGGATVIRVTQGLVLATNKLDPDNFVELRNRSAAYFDPQTRRLTPLPYLDLRSRQLAQTFLYYPGLLHVDDLRLPHDFTSALHEAVRAYQQGALNVAAAKWPDAEEPHGNGPRLFQAALVLSFGDLARAQELLSGLSPEEGDYATHARLANALRQTMAAVQGEDWHRDGAPELASEWLAESYYQQSRTGRPYSPVAWERAVYRGASDGVDGFLERALLAAKRATPDGSSFGFGWVRRAELEFSFGRVGEAERCLEAAGEQREHNAQAVALRGFLAWARNNYHQAWECFQRAASLDPRLGNAWLGLGLTRLRQENVFAWFRHARLSDLGKAQADSEGLSYLEAAVAAEPERSLTRSYLGKAYYDAAGLWGATSRRFRTNALEQLELAAKLDPQDPTPHFYSALVALDENQVNAAVQSAERALELNDQRQLFRSRLLLDQDRAVRGVNLARIYSEAGLSEVGFREAAVAVQHDYANYSAHLFLANAYNGMRDPGLVNLRYETPTLSEYLLANLLSPVGGTPLSAQVSQQEYARLFERDRLGVSFASDYDSGGSWSTAAAQHGVVGGSAYAVEGAYRSLQGSAPNTSLDQRAFSVQVKQRLSPDDSLYLQAVADRVQQGDLQSYYDPQWASSTRRIDDVQEPNLFAGFHHQWSPGHHSLLLLSYLHDDLTLADSQAAVPSLTLDDAGVATNTLARACAEVGFGDGNCDAFAMQADRRFRAFGAEFQQIFTLGRHVVVGGFRWVTGTSDNRAWLTYAGPWETAPMFPASPMNLEGRGELVRTTGYVYDHWRIADSLTLVSGLTLDWLRYPEDVAAPTLTDEEVERSQWSPKVGLLWRPRDDSRVRVAYSRSLGGLYQDSSVRLEPTQVAGVNQAYRSLAPESLVGSLSAAKFDVFGAGGDHQLSRRLYGGWDFEWLRSRGDDALAVFAGRPDESGGLVPTSVARRVEFTEKSASLYANQLLGEGWSWGVRYRLSDAELSPQTLSVSPLAWPEANAKEHALLHHVSLALRFNHRSGWFARLLGRYLLQDIRSSFAGLDGDSFWQCDAVVGHRFLRRRAELSLGLLNLTDQDYRLHPVNAYSQLPRERTFAATFRLDF